jgi:lipocalin-like protein
VGLAVWWGSEVSYTAPSIAQGVPVRSLADSLIGTWRLELWELVYEDGRPPEHPLGADAEGFLMYTPDGHVSATLARKGRPPLAGGDDGTKARAYEAYFGYAGRYEVRDGAVVHHIAIAPDPALTGATTLRNAVLEGDRLTLSGPDFSAGSRRSHRILWRRAGG